MKTFDIKNFKKNIKGLDYQFIDKDSSIVIQNESQLEYRETIQPKNSFFHTINLYHKSGKLKTTYQIYPDLFLKGVRKEYDEQGNLVKETDYDAPYKFTWENVLKLIKERKIDMSHEQFQVNRSFGFGTENIGKETEKPFWAVTYGVNGR
ncbi:hypothetical protein ACFSTE_15705, partial [Aquimarina hainanensis]